MSKEYDDMIADALQDADEIEYQSTLSLDDGQVNNISDLSTEMLHLEDYIAKLDRLRKEAVASLTEISERQLPDAMDNANVRSIQLKDGSSLTVSMKYIGSITAENQDAALEWFKETGRSGVVTPILTVNTQKGHLKEAEAIYDRLMKTGVGCTLKPSVHWQTLRALVRELYEEGDEIPDCISTHVIKTASIKRKV